MARYSNLLTHYFIYYFAVHSHLLKNSRQASSAYFMVALDNYKTLQPDGIDLVPPM